MIDTNIVQIEKKTKNQIKNCIKNINNDIQNHLKKEYHVLILPKAITTEWDFPTMLFKYTLKITCRIRYSIDEQGNVIISDRLWHIDGSNSEGKNKEYTNLGNISNVFKETQIILLLTNIAMEYIKSMYFSEKARCQLIERLKQNNFITKNQTIAIAKTMINDICAITIIPKNIRKDWIKCLEKMPFSIDMTYSEDIYPHYNLSINLLQNHITKEDIELAFFKEFET